MPQLYIFIAAMLMATLITLRRHWISEKVRKVAFKRKVSSAVDEMKEQEKQHLDKRFRDYFTQEQKKVKFDMVKYKESMRKADVAMAKKNWSLAKALLIQALSSTNDRLPASMKLANIYMQTHDFRRAENLYSQLIELTPKNPEIHENLGVIYLQKKRYKDAIMAYVRAVESDEKNDRLLIGLGKLYQMLMRPSLAAECFRAAAELKPREVDYLFLLADCCASDEDFDNALFTYERILTIEPYNEKAKSAAQDVRIKMKENEAVIKTIISQKREVSVS